MRERCGDLPEEECERRVEEAKRLVLEADVAPQLVFPDTQPEDWLDCGQCRDCFKPAFGYRPGQQHPVRPRAHQLRGARRSEAAPPLPLRVPGLERQPHRAARAPDTRQEDRHLQTDTGARPPGWSRGSSNGSPGERGDVEDPRQPQPVPPELRGLAGLRSASRASGTRAVWSPSTSEGRTGDAIFDALRRREVYATSGPRILLWFDLLNAPGAPPADGERGRPGGDSALRSAGRGRFRAEAGLSGERAGGSRARAPGSSLPRPSATTPATSSTPSCAIEVMRIRPQSRPDEAGGGPDRGSLEAIRVRARPGRLRGALRGRGVRRRRTRCRSTTCAPSRSRRLPSTALP